MKDEDKTKEQLIIELVQLRQKVVRLDKEITECKLPERPAEEREERLESKLNTLLSIDREIDEEEISQFIDYRAIQELMDYFYKVTKIGIAILDLKGNILVATGWQDICMNFHRVHPEALRNCIESDLLLSRNVEQGRYVLYKCKNNMWDMSTPIIAGDRHIANLFLGQFFFEDEMPDYEIFANQAKMYGFDEEEYLAALDRVPRWSRETVQNVMEFYTRFAGMVSSLSYGNIKLVRLLSGQKQAEEVLRASETKYRIVADNPYDWEHWLSPEGQFLYTSPSCERITGYSASEFEIDPELLSRIVHPDDLTQFEAHLEEKATKGPCELEFRIIHRDGTTRWIGHVCQPVFDAEGSFLGRRGSNRDITDRKRAEQEKEELEMQLWQAQKLEAIGTLAGGIAHDFNNILAIIMFNLDHLRSFSSAFSEESSDKSRLDDAFKACVRAKDLVQQILVFSRMESRIERQPVNLGTLINETLRFLRSSLPTTIEIRRNISDKDLLVSANATQIQQVLTNLCTNAAHAMEERGGILEVSLTKVDFDSDAVLPHGDIKPGPWVKLTVSDTGQGMDAWTLERIFDPYFTTKKVGKGSGLGLSVVRGIVKQHEGAITIHSEPGKDTTFDVYLPRIEGQATTEGEVGKVPAQGHGTHPFCR